MNDHKWLHVWMPVKYKHFSDLLNDSKIAESIDEVEKMGPTIITLNARDGSGVALRALTDNLSEEAVDSLEKKLNSLVGHIWIV